VSDNFGREGWMEGGKEDVPHKLRAIGQGGPCIHHSEGLLSFKACPKTLPEAFNRVEAAVDALQDTTD